MELWLISDHPQTPANSSLLQVSLTPGQNKGLPKIQTATFNYYFCIAIFQHLIVYKVREKKANALIITSPPLWLPKPYALFFEKNKNLFEDNSGVWYCHSHKKGEMKRYLSSQGQLEWVSRCEAIKVICISRNLLKIHQPFQKAIIFL